MSALTAVDPTRWLSMAAGAGVCLAGLHMLRGLHQSTHTGADPCTAASSSVHCPPLPDSDRTLFPQFIASASVPGIQLYTRCWRVASSPPRMTVFILHGFGEHSGRYESLALALNLIGANVYALDHQGHGQSGGDAAYVQQFDHYVVDALHWIERVQQGEEFQQCTQKPPAFLLGHSMGGLIATHVMQASYTPLSNAASSSTAAPPASASSAASPSPTALQSTWRGRLWPWRGCVLSSPALAPNPADAHPLLVSVLGTLSRVLPKLTLTSLDLAGLSRNPLVAEHYRADPLNWKGGMRARWAAEMMGAMRRVQDDLAAGAVCWPSLVIQGTHDTLVHVQGAFQLQEGSRVQDKTLRVFEGGFHELLLDEITQGEATEAITQWMLARCDGKEQKKTTGNSKGMSSSANSE